MTGELPYIKLRRRADGTIRPRFEPGPRERALGFRARDLKHRDGRWFTEVEAAAFASSQMSAIETARGRQGNRRTATVRLPGVSVQVQHRAPPKPDPVWPSGATTPPHFAAPGFIYFVRVGMRVKIGYSTNPLRRVETLRTALPEIDSLVTVPGSIADERALHLLLYDHRLEREWFLNAPALQDVMVASLIYGRIVLPRSAKGK